MTDGTEIEASFSIDEWDETVYDDPAEGPKLTRVSLRKTYLGAIEGVGVADVLTAQGNGGGYVASERIVGSLDGRSGSFVIQHAGVAEEDGTQSTSGRIVPGSGTGDLASLAGEAAENQQGVLSLRIRTTAQ